MERISTNKKSLGVASGKITPGKLLAEKLAKYPANQNEVTALAEYLDWLLPPELYHLRPGEIGSVLNIETGKILEILTI